MRGVRRSVLAAVMVVLGLGLLVPAAAAAPWGACGLGTEESKVVAQYVVNARTTFTLRCGSPRYDSNPRWGFRHILANHRENFEALAADTDQNWRDVADLALESISRDPDVAKPAGNGKGCYSRLIFMRNLRTNQIVRSQIVRMFVVISTGDIITLYPHDSQCP